MADILSANAVQGRAPGHLCQKGEILDLERLRHSTAHVMAAAVCRVFDGVQLDIGPSTSDGFYYDFDLAHRITPEDFPAIEAEMSRIIDADIPFERVEVSRQQAAEMLRGQTYKLERLADIPADASITFYRCGDFADLCRGPHLERTGQIKAFKLLSVAGSYYRGLETNPMLQRVYGTAAATPKELKAILKLQEEAKQRDHRRLGRELDLFSMQEDVGPGLIHWHPRGARIRCLIEDFWRQEHFRGGYEILYTPHIGRAGLWETSGHLGFYRESMYAAMEIDNAAYYLKPMNCPFHIQVYKSHKRSYRDLPLRWAELGTVYRYEKAGVLHGLLRVRGFTQDDAHIFCAPDQITGEIKRTLRFAISILRSFGFENISAYLSTRPAKAVGADENWADATAALEQALQELEMDYQVDAGGGAFYGPKVDLKIQDAIGREWQLSTVQFDFNMPERFDVTYTGADGQEHRPYMVHRALLGSLERFFGILVEHYKGAFPLWLAPEQVRVLPLTDMQLDYAQQVVDNLREAGVRTGLDATSGKIGAKIRGAQVQKIPYMLIIGPREADAGLVAVRSRAGGDEGPCTPDEFAARIRHEAVPQTAGDPAAARTDAAARA
ncbi:MAG: threonine--tRNA ligase [Lentisphaerae bacterium]|nr:threonine--tRNA ligase [Lentisphaerota bacterium]